MECKEIKIAYLEYGSIDELPQEEKELAKAAVKAANASYAPYSNFNVGAAVRLEDGTIVPGANQENDAFPSGICAERSAMYAAGAHYPDKAVRELAIVGGPNHTICDDPATPCGACRQVMAQFQKKAGKPMKVILAGAKKVWVFQKVDDILPLIFTSLDNK
ncbi:MAG: cytidine deaminase [Bacteroidales bacterium]|nr:cytidine deaminase [Bacteroidales bacterium]